MSIDKINVMFFAKTMGVGGTEKVVVQLCKILNGTVNKVVVCSSGGVNVKKLEKMGVIHYTIPDVTTKNPWEIIRLLRTILLVVKKEKINVIHTHHRMAAFYVHILGLYKKCAFINTAHNTFTDKRRLTKLAYSHAQIIACGNAVKRNLTDFFGIPKENITVIHNAVESFDGAFCPIKILEDFKKDGFAIVANVGRLSEQKGMEYFIKSLPIVKKAHDKIKYVIAGDGEDRDKLERLSERCGAGGDIIFLGYCESAQGLMAQADIVVLSSLWEGLPLTPIEAFSVGRTIVATSVDGTVEIVSDGENGFLVEPKNPAQLAEKILCLIENKDLKAEFEKKAKETYQTEFSFEMFAKKILEYYGKIKANGGGVSNG